MSEIFRFKEFIIDQSQTTMKIGTDGVLLAAWVRSENINSILDIGTGTGVIALMLSQKNPDAKVVAIEIDPLSAQQAKINVTSSPWRDNIKVINQSVQDFSKVTQLQFDLIVSNPPFFSGGTLSTSQKKADVRHTVKLPHGDLLGAVRNLLSPAGRFAVILPNVEGRRFMEMAKSYNLHVERITEVYPDSNKPLERLLIEFVKKESVVEMDTLFIRDAESNDFSNEYKNLTKDFYLKF